jgi:hypothetical protein
MLCGNWKLSFQYPTAVGASLLRDHRAFSSDLWGSMSVLILLRLEPKVKTLIEAQMGRKDVTADRNSIQVRTV